MSAAMRLAYDAAYCLRFFSKLPIPPLSGESDAHDPARFNRAIRALPLAGALLGSISALILLGALKLGFIPPFAALLGLTTAIVLTGGLHEDGLADTIDGFGGGGSPAKKLDIMRDSRIGSFGACAIGVSLAFRCTAFYALTTKSVMAAVSILIAAGALSRVFALYPLWQSVPARQEGLGKSVAGGDNGSLTLAFIGAVAIGFCPILVAGTPVLTGLSAMGLAFFSVFLLTKISTHQIGGYTGDTLGAGQQLSEIVYFIIICSEFN